MELGGERRYVGWSSMRPKGLALGLFPLPRRLSHGTCRRNGRKAHGSSVDGYSVASMLPDTLVHMNSREKAGQSDGNDWR